MSALPVLLCSYSPVEGYNITHPVPSFIKLHNYAGNNQKQFMECDSPRITLPAHLICFLNMPRNPTCVLSVANKAKRGKTKSTFPSHAPNSIWIHFTVSQVVLKLKMSVLKSLL